MQVADKKLIINELGPNISPVRVSNSEIWHMYIVGSPDYTLLKEV